MEINYNRLAKAITRAGVILVKNGAEISRVEDTMERLCFAYGAKTVDSYANHPDHIDYCYAGKRKRMDKPA